MPSGQIRAIIVSGKPHFHRGLINARIWIKINILTFPLAPLRLDSGGGSTFWMKDVQRRACSIKRGSGACDFLKSYRRLRFPFKCKPTPPTFGDQHGKLSRHQHLSISVSSFITSVSLLHPPRPPTLEFCLFQCDPSVLYLVTAAGRGDVLHRRW